ncbi:hypothetical protein PEC311524_26930 [Pectobacterium carotovorum subsp. carotovorum]|nr:hypothetical protein PEC311524_26930 [Pectobacterium carotovorum subsp. carotovorum]
MQVAKPQEIVHIVRVVVAGNFSMGGDFSPQTTGHQG